MLTFDQAKQNFEIFKTQIKAYTNSDINESDTRSKVIDNLLFNVLGWSELDVQREGKVESGYFDYRISAPGINFIIEAKRNFQSLKLPTKQKKVKVKSILSENREIIEQIRNYSISCGIQYGLITNGNQFVFLKLFNTDGKNWIENESLIFNGINEIEERFSELYNNLSKYSVIANGGFIFDISIVKIESKTLISTLIDRDKELVRNSLSLSLTPIIDKIFGEIFNGDNEDDEKFIENCFVENSETKKNRKEIDRLFADKTPQLSNVIKATNANSIRYQISSEITENEISIKNNTPPKPIVIVGSKGAGKTTFINHLFKSEKKTLKDHLIIYLDFRIFIERFSDVDYSLIANELIETTQNNYPELELHTLSVLKRIYIKKIRENDESIWSYIKTTNEPEYNAKLSLFIEQSKHDYFKHFEYLSKYLIRERRKRIIVIIDNADQFSSQIQEKVFLFAHSLAKSSNCGSIIALREGYYYKWRNSPPFDAYESNVYHITAPKYSEVLLKRINYTLETLELDELKGVSHGRTEGGAKVEVPNQAVIEFLSGLKKSLFSEINHEIVDYLNFTTYPNIREGLRVFKQFLISGHTNVSEYILRERFNQNSNNYRITIPIFEFIKTIGLHNKLYYNSEFSLIYNIFIPPNDCYDHFINIYVLKELFEINESKGSSNKYIMSNEFIDKFVSNGYRTGVVVGSITKLLKNNLIDTDEQLSDIEWEALPRNINIGITAKGHYYYKELITRFHYLDLCLQDTPIFDMESFRKIKSSFPLSDDLGKRNLDSRLYTVLEFFEYLKIQESKQPPLFKSIFGCITEHIFVGLSADRSRIEKKLKEF